MMMEIAVDYPRRKTFVLNAFVKVNQIVLTDKIKQIELLVFSPSLYMQK